MFKVTYTKRFQKHYNKLDTTHKQQIKKTISLLVENPNHPSLRSKLLKGKNNIFESSVNMKVRVLWYYEKNQIIFILDVVQHDGLKLTKK